MAHKDFRDFLEEVHKSARFLANLGSLDLKGLSNIPKRQMRLGDKIAVGSAEPRAKRQTGCSNLGGSFVPIRS